MNNNIAYCFICLGRGLGGLELQMLARTKDALQQGLSAILVVSPNSEIQREAENQGVPTATLTVKIDYVDAFAAYNLAEIISALSPRKCICIVGKTRHLSIALLSEVFYNGQLSVVLYQQMQSDVEKKDFFHRWVYSSLAGAITLTEAMNETLIRRTVIAPDRVKAIPYGIDISRFQNASEQRIPTRQEYGIPENSFVIGCVGRLDPQKDQRTLLRAFAESFKDNPTARLVIAGAETPGEEGYKQVLIQETKSLDIIQQTIFLPFVRNVPALMAALDVHVLTTLSETFGLVTVEAMAAGTVVIGTNAGGVPFIVQNNVNGLLFPPGASSELAGLLEKIYNNSELRHHLSQEGIRTVRERYDYQKQTLLFFRTLREWAGEYAE